MKANNSEIYNREKASIDSHPVLDFDYYVQVSYMSEDAAELTRPHLRELGYEAEVIKVAV